MVRIGRLLAGAIGNAAVKLGGVGAGMLVSICLARMLGPGGFGEYAFAFGVVALLGGIGQMGAQQRVVKEVAASISDGDSQGSSVSIRRSLVMAGIVGLGLAVAMLGVLLVLAVLQVGGYSGLGSTLVVASPLIVLLGLTNVAAGGLRGLKRPVACQIPDRLFRPLLFIGVVGIVYGVEPYWIDPVTVLAIHIVAAAAALAFAGWLLANRGPLARGAGDGRWSGSWPTVSWLKNGRDFATVSTLQVVNRRADVVWLGILSTVENVGPYRVAVQLAALVSFATQVVNMVAAPHLASLYARGQMERLEWLTRRSSQASMLFALPATGVFALFGDVILRTLFGEGFEAAYWPLLILSLGQLVNSWFASSGFVLTMTGHQGRAARAVAAAAVAGTALAVALTPKYEAVGAAISTACAFTIWNGLMAREAYKRVGVSVMPVTRRQSERIRRRNGSRGTE